MEYPVESVAQAIVRQVEEVGFGECRITYQQAVRSMARASQILGQKQLELNLSNGVCPSAA